MGTKNTSTCLANAQPEEPIFVLRAQDFSSPKVILHWISENFDTCPDEKLREALDVALQMKNYPTGLKKQAD